HAYLLWFGDILVTYGICALLAYVFRKKSPKTLFITAIGFLVVPTLIAWFFNWSMPYWPQEALQNNLSRWQPDELAIVQETAIYRNGWTGQLAHRIPLAIIIQTYGLLFFIFWRVMGLMLIGMALYKTGVLSAQKSTRFYVTGLITGLAIGLPLVIFGLVYNCEAGWVMEKSMFLGKHFNYWGSPFISFAYISAVMLICKSTKWKYFKKWLAPVGKMALSNYLLQTIIATLLFYGHGFGLFGRVERFWQLLIVLAIWLSLIIFSNLWLKKFRFGPFEWLWRSLTYMRFQPMKIQNNT
ncbi:MAG: DUF418 domain-containing protein, partial [Bacteroidetes bacterium]|nr:DUF418 domain-containing protein [Bacteroidota bacterium]